MAINTSTPAKISLEGEHLEDVKTFTYLGSVISQDKRVTIGQGFSSIQWSPLHLEVQTDHPQNQSDAIQQQC